MSEINKPYVLSIAGFDPSGGAGVLADVKTFESNGVYGMAVVSALTFQNDIEFERVEWIDPATIIRQVEVLLKRFTIRHIKIGLIESMDALAHIVRYLKTEIDEPVIVYDPILKASAGFSFHNITESQFIAAIGGISCITPNIPEAIRIWGVEELNDKLENLSDRISVYLKGGHSDDSIVTDLLYVKDHTYAFPNDRLPSGNKHGSGCVLSSALTAHLALGADLPTAAEIANAYTHTFLASNATLLGYHQPMNI